jgi:two-component system response regulator RegA
MIHASSLGDRDGQARRLPRQVLVIDDHELFSRRVGGAFRDLGCEVKMARDWCEARQLLEQPTMDLTISEAKVGGRLILGLLAALKQRHPACRVIVATAYPSVAAAVEATRLGLDDYIAKHADAGSLVDLVVSRRREEVTVAPNPRWPSLDRTIWEYINHVYISAGTMSGAALRLGLDRRSLRRMLSKYPPVR